MNSNSGLTEHALQKLDSEEKAQFKKKKNRISGWILNIQTQVSMYSIWWVMVLMVCIEHILRVLGANSPGVERASHKSKAGLTSILSPGFASQPSRSFQPQVSPQSRTPNCTLLSLSIFLLNKTIVPWNMCPPSTTDSGFPKRSVN